MSGCPFRNLTDMSRRSFLKAFGGLAVAAGAGYGARYAYDGIAGNNALKAATIPFYAGNQAGITTPQQGHIYFAALDIVSEKRDDIIKMLQAWTQATARLTKGQPAQDAASYDDKKTPDSDETSSLSPANLTLTFGFGAGMFAKDGKDRYRLANHRPDALVDMPVFNGDQLIAEKSGGDICLQSCADDPQVAFHAVRELVRFAAGTAQIRWTQTGFMSQPPNGETPRNLQGFKDGTQNPKKDEFDKFVWVGSEGPDWMQKGSYLITRKIRIALEHWDNTPVDFQESVIGRHKISGAPLGKKNEFDALDLDATDQDGNFIMPENAHVRLASSIANDGAQILRRGYSYNDGINFVAERWPPWRQGLEYDAGLLFVSFQRDPRTGFIKIFDNMAKFDALNQFVTHIGSSMFACPAGVQEGEYIGQKLFDKA